MTKTTKVEPKAAASETPEAPVTEAPSPSPKLAKNEESIVLTGVKGEKHPITITHN
jgi:hypothetical protein